MLESDRLVESAFGRNAVDGSSARVRGNPALLPSDRRRGVEDVMGRPFWSLYEALELKSQDGLSGLSRASQSTRGITTMSVKKEG